MMSSMLPLLAASMLIELFDDRLFGGDERRDFQPGDAFDVVEREDVERVGHREEQLVVQARDGDDLVILGDFAGQQIREFQWKW